MFERVDALLLHCTCYLHGFVLEKSIFKFGGKFSTKLAPTGWATQGNMHSGGNPDSHQKVLVLEILIARLH